MQEMPASALDVPERFGKYTVVKVKDEDDVIRPLGTGGMAYVWKAWNPTLKYVAIKELKAPNASGESLGQFENEVSIIRSLKRHPSIVFIYDFELSSEERGTPYFIMELMDGVLGDTKHPLRRSPAECVKLLKPIADALDYAYKEKEIVHCDVKPENILFHEDGTPCLSDFGIARWEFSPIPSLNSDGTGGEGMTEIHPRTESSEKFVGTLDYSAPELIAGKSKPSRASDVYSLAVVAFEVLTGEKPFRIADAAAEMDSYSRLTAWRTMHHERQDLPDLTRFELKGGGKLHTYYQEVFQRALNKDPDLRYTTADSFIDDLEKARVSGPKYVLVSLQELPGLVRGRVDEGSKGLAAEAYHQIYRQGKIAVAVWLVITLVVAGLWVAGHLGDLQPFLQRRSWADLLNENALRGFSTRLLGQWWFMAAVAITSLLFLLSRLLGRVAERADYDRYWHEEKIVEIKEGLLGVVKVSYKRGKKAPGRKFPKVEDYYRRAGIAAPKDFPESPPYQTYTKACTDLVSKCREQRRLFRLQDAVRRENRELHARDAALLQRRLSRKLKWAERFALVFCLVMIALAVPAVSYWLTQPQEPLAAPSALAMISLWLGGLAIFWRVLSR